MEGGIRPTGLVFATCAIESANEPAAGVGADSKQARGTLRNCRSVLRLELSDGCTTIRNFLK